MDNKIQIFEEKFSKSVYYIYGEKHMKKNFIFHERNSLKTILGSITHPLEWLKLKTLKSLVINEDIE